VRAGAAGVCGVGGRALFRGTIVVRVQWDPDSKEEMFSVLISRSTKTPVIENPTAYKKKLDWLGQRKRRFEAWHIERSTTFRAFPRASTSFICMHLHPRSPGSGLERTL